MEGSGNKEKTALWVTLGVLVVLLIVAWVFVTRQANSDSQGAAAANATEGTELSSELIVEDVKTGDGAEAQNGSTVSVHYVGTLQSGVKFDSSRDRGEPFVFTIGAGQVIQGWELGITGMKVGGVRKLVIPPELAYGERDLGAIPPNSTLLFEVELLAVVDNKG